MSISAIDHANSFTQKVRFSICLNPYVKACVRMNTSESDLRRIIRVIKSASVALKKGYT